MGRPAGDRPGTATTPLPPAQPRRDGEPACVPAKGRVWPPRTPGHPIRTGSAKALDWHWRGWESPIRTSALRSTPRTTVASSGESPRSLPRSLEVALMHSAVAGSSGSAVVVATREALSGSMPGSTAARRAAARRCRRRRSSPTPATTARSTAGSATPAGQEVVAPAGGANRASRLLVPTMLGRPRRVEQRSGLVAVVAPVDSRPQRERYRQQERPVGSQRTRAEPAQGPLQPAPPSR